MSFRKRNIGIVPSRTPNIPNQAQEAVSTQTASRSRPTVGRASRRGVRPSPLDGSSVVSTGTPSLDSLLGGHSGLVLGNGLLIEESGATDYAGTLLRFYAAEGVLQGHAVHVIGVSENWARELPGIAKVAKDDPEKDGKTPLGENDRMKIAWRYERFGSTGAGSPRDPGSLASSPDSKASEAQEVFCHAFDLTKRLELPSSTAINVIPIRATSASSSPFVDALKALEQQLSSTPDSIVHRVVIPGLLSPASYPPWACLPQHVIRFCHALRALLKQNASRMSAMVSLPITLYPRQTGLTRWIEILADGVMELNPFPHTVDVGPMSAATGSATAQEEKPQGMAKLHKLPVIHERGGVNTGLAGVGDDLAFTVTRRRFVIKPYSLPPIEGDTEAQKGGVDATPTKASMEF